MARLKRGSATLEKASRRFASLRSLIDPLDFGNGLSLTEYDTHIQALQAQLSNYNTMLSTLDEMSGQIALMEQELRSYSEKMLLGVATRYGKDSLQYMQAGGKPRKSTIRRSSSTTPLSNGVPSTNTIANGNANGNGAVVASS